MEKRVVELFAGVGGFRVGLNNIKKIDKNGNALEDGPFTFVWSNQWEPSTKKQDAFECYNKRFPSEHNSNVDITKVNKKNIPDHDLLVGGFPCQDYSVAHTLSKSKGIEGKKGVLWWDIHKILEVKRPPFVLLENVDRLLKSPASQRGRDFGIILKCFLNFGYDVQWRVVNAAEQGFPQRRKRIFIFASNNRTEYSNRLASISPENILIKDGIFAQTYKVKEINKKDIKSVNLKAKTDDMVKFSNTFKFDFKNAGVLVSGTVYTAPVETKNIKTMALGEIVVTDKVDSKYFLTKSQIAKFKYLRGSKKIQRTKPNGEKYFYSEGAMSPFDDLSKPGRTMLTSECTNNRSTHIIKDPQTNRLRFLLPVECERLNQFPDNWTNVNMTERKRAFMMGNALVCGIIKDLSKPISEIIDNEN